MVIVYHPLQLGFTRGCYWLMGQNIVLTNGETGYLFMTTSETHCCCECYLLSSSSKLKKNNIISNYFLILGKGNH